MRTANAVRVARPGLHTKCVVSTNRTCRASATESAEKYNWDLNKKPSPHKTGEVMELPVASIRRPLGRTRSNDQQKVTALMDSIQEVGLKEPVMQLLLTLLGPANAVANSAQLKLQIDILEVEGKYYGFSGCHRYEAFQKLGLEQIPCRVRKANQNTLKMHMM